MSYHIIKIIPVNDINVVIDNSTSKCLFSKISLGQTIHPTKMIILERQRLLPLNVIGILSDYYQRFDDNISK